MKKVVVALTWLYDDDHLEKTTVIPCDSKDTAKKVAKKIAKKIQEYHKEEDDSRFSWDEETGGFFHDEYEDYTKCRILEIDEATVDNVDDFDIDITDFKWGGSMSISAL